MDEIVLGPEPREPYFFAARMTNLQFHAFAIRCAPEAILAETRTLLATRTLVRGKLCDSAVVSRWLVNGWSTEQLLRTNLSSLRGEALRHSLHWAFPQAYYSAFAVLLAAFKSLGYTEDSHTSTIRRFGLDALIGKYPSSLCSIVTDFPFQYHALQCTSLSSSLHFDPSSQDTVDGQIAQALRSTREIDLRDRKIDAKLKTKRGGRKRALSQADWKRLSDNLGPTSILSFLYRKRIKANYRDIDTFLHEELDVESLYRHLLRILGALNFVNEALVARVLTLQFLRNTADRLPAASDGPRARLSYLVEVGC